MFSSSAMADVCVDSHPLSDVRCTANPPHSRRFAWQDTEMRTEGECRTATEINLISTETIQQRARLVLSASDADASALPALATAMTNLLLFRVFESVWGMDCNELAGWSKQRALAKVVSSVCGRSLPSWADAERPGQRMHEFISRYRQRRRQLLEAEKRAARRASARHSVESRTAAARCPSQAFTHRMELDEGLFVCRYGCTPAKVAAYLHPPSVGACKVEVIPT